MSCSGISNRKFLKPSLSLLIVCCCAMTILYLTQTCMASNDTIHVYKEIAGDHPLKIKGTSASFHDGKAEWTIFGAVQQKAEPYLVPSSWPIGKEACKLLVVAKPVSDIIILPNSEPVPNTVDSGTIELNAYRDEHVPISFVIRSGSQPLKNIEIKVSSLKNREGAEISPKNIDVRGVKCWYQAGLDVSRQSGDKKRLTPELLLHDLDLVRVDHKHQVNLVRDLSRLKDADIMLPFDLPAQTNQQIWISAHIPVNTDPGKYAGKIEVTMAVGSQKYKKVLDLAIRVSSLNLKALPIEHALFYLAWYAPNQTGLGARGKNARQMLAEFKDMRAHGLTNVAIDHQFRTTLDGEPDFSNLEPVIKLFREAGFDTKRFLYVDWKVAGWDKPGLYRRKIEKLKQLVTKYGFTELYVYNKDEQEYEALNKSKHTFEIVHQLGAKNFVACERNTAMMMRGLLDQAILPRYASLQGFHTPELNLCVNGDMSVGLERTGAAWKSTNKAFMFIQHGRLRKKPGAYVYFAQLLPFERGTKYRLEYDVISARTPGFLLAAGGGSAVDKDIELPLLPGKNSIVFTSNNYDSLRFAAASPAAFEITNIVVTKLEKGPTAKMGVWAYCGPQAGQETPETYRERYGTSLVSDGFDGVCNYAYQSGDCWDDWAESNWRPHVMAYPTAGAPIPTIQWEGWRKAIDDIRSPVNRRLKDSK